MSHKKNPYKAGLYRIVDIDTQEEIARNLTYECAIEKYDEDFEKIESQNKVLTNKMKMI